MGSSNRYLRPVVKMAVDDEDKVVRFHLIFHEKQRS